MIAQTLKARLTTKNLRDEFPSLMAVPSSFRFIHAFIYLVNLFMSHRLI